MRSDWVDLFREVWRLKEERFRQLLRELCGAGELLIVLFGSRARGDSTPASDYDLLIVSNKAGRRGVEVRWPAQLFRYSLEEARRRLEEGDTILLDALTEGKLLCGDERLFNELRGHAQRVIGRLGIEKTRIGWVLTTLSTGSAGRGDGVESDSGAYAANREGR